MSLAQRLIPKRLQERAKPLIDRYEAFLREFEWTWTKAAIAALLLWFAAIVTIGVIPSFWLYYSQRPPLLWTANHFWLFKLRDLVAIVLFSAPVGAFVVLPYRIQNHRRRLRGASESRPTGGYR